MTIREDPEYRKYLREHKVAVAKQMKRVWKWYDGDRMAIALFTGNKGDIKIDRYVKDITREEAPFSTGLVSGMFLKNRSTDGTQRIYRPGETTDGDPDIKRGFVECICLEDNTVVICIGPVSPENKRFVWEQMYKKSHFAKEAPVEIILQKGHISALVYGSVVTPSRTVFAPGVIAAKNADMKIILQPNSTLMEGWR